MKTITLERADDFHKVLKNYRKSSNYKFRGQSNSNWKLVPKAGRKEYSKVRDYEMFRQWKRRGLTHLQNSTLSDWDYLVAAQHTGLPTRLLDWSHIPLTAAFFASNENFDQDGAIWIAKPVSYFYDHTIDPFALSNKGVIFYQPSSPVPRAANQFSYFTVHNPPSLELTNDNTELD